MARSLLRIMLCLLIPLVFNFPMNEEAVVLYNSTNQLPSASAPGNKEFRCRKDPIFKRKFLYMSHCMKASNQLPSTDTSGYFHRGNPLDRFQLPQSGTHGSCTVEISLIGNSGEESSWVAVKDVIVKLLSACLVEGAMYITKPGWTTVGSNDRINISTYRPPMVERVPGQSIEVY